MNQATVIEKIRVEDLSRKRTQEILVVDCYWVARHPSCSANSKLG